MLVDVADGREVGIEVEPYRNGVIDARLPAPDERRGARPGLGAPGSRRLPRDVPRRGAPAGRRSRPSTRPRSSGSASTSPRARCSRPRPTARRCASSTPIRRNPHAWVKLWKHHAAQPEADDINRVAGELRPAVARTLRRQDLVRVVLPEGAPDPARGARDLSRRGPAGRGCRLGGLAAHRQSRRGTTARPATRRCGRPRTDSRTRRSSRRSSPASARSSTTR